MLTQEEYRLEENIKRWNIFFALLFAVLCILSFWYLDQESLLPYAVSVFDAVILVLAVFRLIRLIAYDNIFLFLREAFLDVKRVKYAETGEEQVERVLSANSFKRTVWKLLNCPWCLGIWVALGVTFAFFAFPEIWIFFALFAVAGVASLVQVFSNLIGWSAEHKKALTQKDMHC